MPEPTSPAKPADSPAQAADIAAEGITPARLGERAGCEGAPGVPYSPDYDDVYHAAAGAQAQAQHVFLRGNGLPERWRGRAQFVVLETGFGLGNNFLSTWGAWRADPERSQRLVFISIEKHPLTVADLRRVHGLAPAGRVTANAPHATPGAPPAAAALGIQAAQPEAHDLAERLCEAWPPLTPGLHLLDFDEPELAPPGQCGVTLMLGLGDIADLLPQLLARADAFFLDGFAPAKNPAMWNEHLLSRLNRLAAPGATVATWSVARGVRDALGQAGFLVEKAPGFEGKREMLLARYQPRFEAPPLPGGLWPRPERAKVGVHHANHAQHAIVIGAGLAGCAAAWALSREGWQVTVIEQHTAPAREASGNEGGLFHSLMHGQSTTHTRAYRAAALLTTAVAGPWVRQGVLAGQCDGLVRLEPRLTDAEAQRLLAKQGLPPEHVRWLPHAEAQAFSGLALASGGWLFLQGGWLDPAGYAKTLLAQARAAGLLQWHSGVPVASLQRSADGHWRALAANGEVLAQAPCVVMCHAHGAAELVQRLLPDTQTPPMPLARSRGQITWLGADWPGLCRPCLPVAGDGYALSLPDGRVLCGATTQSDDLDPTMRWADHQHNLTRVARLGVIDMQSAPGVVDLASTQAPPDWGAGHPTLGFAALGGRVAWRATTPDRLPLVGALPQLSLGSACPEQVRRVPRFRDAQGGLYVLSGLGSRGITWAALAGRLISHWVTGAPCPVEADIRDALDPARFVVRQQRGAKRPLPDGAQHRPATPRPP